MKLILALYLLVYILWSDSNDIEENLKDYMKEFNIKQNPLSSVIEKTSKQNHAKLTLKKSSLIKSIKSFSKYLFVNFV
jgi:transcription antitermination factor NusG